MVLFILVDRYIVDTQGRDIVKKVRALRWFGVDFFTVGFDDDPHCANIRPFNRYSEPAVGRSPSSRPDQQVFEPLFQQPSIDLAKIIGNSQGTPRNDGSGRSDRG